MDEAHFRTPLPGELVKVLGIEPQTGSKAAAFTEAFLMNGLQHPARHDLKSMLAHKAVVLGYTRPKAEGPNKKKKKAKGLNARQKRTMKIFEIKPEHQRYELFLPLHELWRTYIADLCGGLKPCRSVPLSSSQLPPHHKLRSPCPSSSPQFVQQKLLKADFHGAVLTVVRSKCPSYVGTTGILVQEFKHVFKIITKEDKLKVIPKRNSVFSVEVNGFVSHIFGSRFEQRASERSAKKFKVKGTMDL